MRRPTPLLLFAITALLVMGYVAYVYVLPAPKSLLMGYHDALQQQFDEFEIGDSKEQLLELFGKPRVIGPHFSHEIHYRKSDFTAEDLAMCVEYATYSNGNNWFYCFGIDENGKVVIKADGHS